MPSLWAKEAAIAKARDLSDVTSVVSDALDIERAENDRAIVEQIAEDIWRVSIPGLAAAARAGVSAAPGIAESQQPSGHVGRHGTDVGLRHGRFGGCFREARFHVGDDYAQPHTSGADLHGPASLDGHLYHGFGIDGDGQLQIQLDEALFAHRGNAFYGVFDSVSGWVDTESDRGASRLDLR